MKFIRAKIPSFLLYLFWIVLIVASIIFLSSSILKVLDEIQKEKFFIQQPWLFALACLLLLPNILLESAKWKDALAAIEPLNWLKAIKSTLAGMSISAWMPNRIGEYLGRVYHLKPKNKLFGAISSIFTSAVQFLVTSTFGLISAIYCGLVYQKLGLHFAYVVLAVLLVFLILIILFFDKSKYYFKLLLTVKQYRLLKLVFWTYSRFSTKFKLRILIYSILRFFVFSVQYALLLWAFGMSISFFTALILIALIYGSQTIIPSSALIQLGARGVLAVLIFKLDPSFIESAVLSATYTLWLINVLLPSIAGLFFLIFVPEKSKLLEEMKVLLLNKKLS